jgi:hypothetical protein
MFYTVKSAARKHRDTRLDVCNHIVGATLSACTLFGKALVD